MNARPSFDFVSMQLMLEETEPTPEALERWQQLYPDWSLSLEEFFSVWAMALDQADKYEPEMDEEDDDIVIPDKLLNQSIEMFRQQGRVVRTGTKVTLSPIDRAVLHAAHLLRGRGDMVDIAEKVKDISGKDVFLATVMGALERLEAKSLIESRLANPETEPENEGTQYFMATMAGERALLQAAETASDLLGDFA